MDNDIANEFPPESDSDSDGDHTHHNEDEDVVLMSDLLNGIYFKQNLILLQLFLEPVDGIVFIGIQDEHSRASLIWLINILIAHSNAAMNY